MLESWAESRSELTQPVHGSRVTSRYPERNSAERRFGLRDDAADAQTPSPPQADAGERSKRQSTARSSVHDERQTRRLAIQVDLLQERIALQSLSGWFRSVVAVNLFAVTTLLLSGAPWHSATLSEILAGATRLSALGALVSLLTQLVLSSRPALLDRLFDNNHLRTWQRTAYRFAFGLLAIHLLVAGAASAVDSGVHAAGLPALALTSTYLPFVLAMCAIAIAATAHSQRDGGAHSVRMWQGVHRTTYAALVVAFIPSMINQPIGAGSVGASFVTLLIVLGFAQWMYFRVVQFALVNHRHQLRVRRIVDEGNGVVSMYMAGKNLDRLQFQPGQFCRWRLVSRHSLLHPLALHFSVAPNSDEIRIVVKATPEAKAFIDAAVAGRRVLFSGPFGRLTASARRTVRSVMVADGTGIAAVRNLADTIESAPGDMTIIYRVQSRHEAILVEELQALAVRRGALIHIVCGAASDFPLNGQPMTPDHLEGLVPAIVDADVYICADADTTRQATHSLAALRVPRNRIHIERLPLT